MSPNEPPEGSELTKRLEIISALPLSSGYKAELALIALQEKPATDIKIFYSVGGDRRVFDIEQKLADAGLSVVPGREKIFREDYGIPVEFSATGGMVKLNHFCTIYIATSVEDATKLQELGEKYFFSDAPIEISRENHRTLGRLFGFPESAILAYINGEQPMNDDLPEDIRSQDYAFFLQFALSKNNWRQEIETAKRWYNALSQYAPTILKEYIDGIKAWQAERERLRRD